MQNRQGDLSCSQIEENFIWQANNKDFFDHLDKTLDMKRSEFMLTRVSFINWSALMKSHNSTPRFIICWATTAVVI